MRPVIVGYGSDTGERRAMLPALTYQSSIDDVVLSYLNELESAGFTGDIEKSYATVRAKGNY